MSGQEALDCWDDYPMEHGCICGNDCEPPGSMSGDVTAAIERLRGAHARTAGGWWIDDSKSFDRPGPVDVRNGNNASVAKDVEPYAAELLVAARESLPALLAEVERLGAEPDNEAVARTVQMLRDESARLRAEREVLLKRTTCPICWAETRGTATPEADQ